MTNKILTTEEGHLPRTFWWLKGNRNFGDLPTNCAANWLYYSYDEPSGGSWIRPHLGSSTLYWVGWGEWTAGTFTRVDWSWHDSHDKRQKRLNRLLQRLKQDLNQLFLHNPVIQDQPHQGIVEVIADLTNSEDGRVHYLLHHVIDWYDNQTTKWRVIDTCTWASCSGSSLNDCHYTGPEFEQNIPHIVLRIRLYNMKAFLMVSVAE